MRISDWSSDVCSSDLPAQQSECFHRGGHRNLQWDDGFLAKGEAVRLMPGEALLVPVKAPHFVQNGPAVSISFSITWRSERSVAEGELHSLHARLRRFGLPLPRLGRTPQRHRLSRLETGSAALREKVGQTVYN